MLSRFEYLHWRYMFLVDLLRLYLLFMLILVALLWIFLSL
jgi:hypothetical protein